MGPTEEPDELPDLWNSFSAPILPDCDGDLSLWVHSENNSNSFASNTEWNFQPLPIDTSPCSLLKITSCRIPRKGSSMPRCQSSSGERKYIQIAANHPAAEQYHNLLPQLLPYLCHFQKFIITLALVELPNNPRGASIPTIIIGLSNYLRAIDTIFQNLCGSLDIEVLHILEETDSAKTQHISESTYQAGFLAPGASLGAKHIPTSTATLAGYLRDQGITAQAVSPDLHTCITPISKSYNFGNDPSRCSPVSFVTQSSRVHRAHDIARLEREMESLLEELDVNLPERHTPNSAAARLRLITQKLMGLHNAEFYDRYLNHNQGHENYFGVSTRSKGLASASRRSTNGEEVAIKSLGIEASPNSYSSEISPSTAKIAEEPTRRLSNSTVNGVKATANEGETVVSMPCMIVADSDELSSSSWRMKPNIIALVRTYGAISQRLQIKLLREVG
ncbi:hypothetical protein BGX38DRAFT_1165711 [Terfezia claveryi]|nr:hypothetical protein BGX38DRAFT_1165711 [Terfezia claveryi]